MIYLKLFLTFLEIGAVSFGGGYGMMSLMREKMLAFGWITEEELLNMIARADSRKPCHVYRLFAGRCSRSASRYPRRSIALVYSDFAYSFACARIS